MRIFILSLFTSLCLVNGAAFSESFQKNILQAQMLTQVKKPKEIRIRSSNKPVLILTIPKAGTHLLEKTIQLITNEKVNWVPLNLPNLDLSNVELFFRNNKIGQNHLLPAFDIFQQVPSENMVKIILVRDPRDVVISEISWINTIKDWVWATPRSSIDNFNEFSWDQKIKEIAYFPGNFLSTKAFFAKAIEWKNQSDALICRYEDLVGSKGGGDDERQKAVIKEIAEKMGYFLSDTKISEIADSLYGNTSTFRVGKIEGWRTILNKEELDILNKEFENEIAIFNYNLN